MEINAYGTIMFLMALIATRLIVLNLAYRHNLRIPESLQ